MRTFMRFVGGIVVLVLVLAGVAFVLPREVTVTRSAEIAAPPSKVFAELDSLQDFATWSPWQADDLENTFSGPESGVGNKMEWTSKDLGTGTQEITAIEQDARVETALDFGDMGTAKAAFILEPAGEGTAIEWQFVGDMGMNPIGRWMGLMMDTWVGGDYERGLANLKAKVETGE